MNVFLGVTGASGAPYAARLLRALADSGCEVGIAASAAGVEVLASELGPNVTVNCICPAGVPTTDMGRQWLGLPRRTCPRSRPTRRGAFAGVAQTRSAAPRLPAYGGALVMRRA